MKNIILLALCLLVSFSCKEKKEVVNEDKEIEIVNIDKDRMYKIMEVLTSDSLAGRRAGMGYDLKAARYIVRELSNIGLKPLFNNNALVEFTIPEDRVKRLNLDTSISYNVAMYIPSERDSADVLVLGAHYDHLGVVETTTQRGRKGEIYRGANDNASGTTSIIELSRVLFQNRDKFKHDLVVVAFGGEEMGLVGSRHIAKMMQDSAINVKHAVNLEMLGTMVGDSLMLMGDLSFKEMGDVMAKTENKDSINVIKSERFITASDHASFYRENIPVSLFITSGDKYIHTTQDNIDIINFDGMVKANRYIQNYIMTLLTLDTLPAFTAVE